MIGAHHAAALREVAERFVPEAEAVLPTIGRALAEAIERHAAALRANLRPDVAQAVAIHGRSLANDRTAEGDALADATAERRHRAFLDLASALGRGAASLRALVSPLVEDMHRALELCASAARGDLTEAELVIVLDGDSAFRALHYFLEITRPLLEQIRPRSMLELRARRS